MFRVLNNWSIRWKLISSTVLILLVAFIVLGFQQVSNMTSIIEGEALEKAQSDLQTSLAIIDYKYPGEWKLEGEELYKGDHLMNDNLEIVDLIGELTNGDTATLFARDMSVTSNVMVEGERGIGTKVIQEVADKVLDKGEVFLEKADVLGHTYQTAYTPLKDKNGEIIGMWYIGAPDASDRIQEIKKGTTWSILLSGTFILLIALGIYYLLMKSILGRIELASVSLVKVAEGDLSFTIPETKSKDETGLLLNAVNGMITQLRTLLYHTKEVSTQVASASDELTASTAENTKAVEQVSVASESVVRGAEEQQTSVKDAISIVDKMSNEMNKSIVHSEEVAQLAEEVSLASSKGMDAIGIVLSHMQEIDGNVIETAVIIRNLNEQSHEINDIISLITDIADQTNLLALNAAIESARAGEMGKGFAVVADEVRKLAEQSSQSSERIARLIIEMQQATQEAVQSMEVGTGKTKAGMVETEQANNMFVQVNESIANVTPKTAELSKFIRAMAERSKQLVALIEQVGLKADEGLTTSLQNNTATEEQLATMEEIARSAINLAALSEDMTQTFEKFKME